MHVEHTIEAGVGDFGPMPNVNVYPPPSNHTAPPEWLGTPMEMVADAFGMDSPWHNRERNWNKHKLKAQVRRTKRNKAAKAARKRNRRK